MFPAFQFKRRRKKKSGEERNLSHRANFSTYFSQDLALLLPPFWGNQCTNLDEPAHFSANLSQYWIRRSLSVVTPANLLKVLPPFRGPYIILKA